MGKADRIERVVLLGFMCSGKSTVGKSLAERLEWDLLDFDAEIESREGRSVSSIIEAEGESYFRRLEAELTAEVAGAKRIVLAPGGGWIVEPERLESLRPNTFAVWLSVSADETVRRLRTDCVDRPFRNHPDPVVPIREMLAERAPLYRLSDLTIPTDNRRPESVAFEIEQLVRLRRGLA